MSRNVANTGFYDEGVIDDRNERPLVIAFVTTVTMWMLAFAVAVAFTHLGA